MDGVHRHEYSKDIIFNTDRRSAISTSELGLYSDHSDYYNTVHQGSTVRKFAIGIMVVVSVLLIAIFLYDFASSASVSSKASQETKHIYILQHPLRKPNFSNRKSSSSVTNPPIYNNSHVLEDRSDDDRALEYNEEVARSDNRTDHHFEPELRSQNLNNFKLRSEMISQQRDELYDLDGNPLDDKQIVDNHAMIYHRMRGFKQYESATPAPPDGPDGAEVVDDPDRSAPFHFELKGPQPVPFKRPKYPQLSQYRYPHASRNIQDIIKYLTNDPETLNRGIKFTGYYVNPKKYDSSQTEIGVVNGGNGAHEPVNEEQESAPPPYAIALNADPLYQYKPKHPTDVNLLATSNLRFSPVGLQRYNPFFDPYYLRLNNQNKHSIYQENQFDGAGAFSTNFGKRRKPKPFSVMLDIYPITETGGFEQTKKSSKLKTQPATVMMADEPLRQQLMPYFARYPKVYSVQGQPPQTIPLMQSQEHFVPEDDEKHQMILHLNLYPKRKSKYTREDTIDRTTIMSPDEKTHLIEKLMVPFNALTKRLRDHAVIEEAKLDERRDSLLDKYELIEGAQEAIRKVDKAEDKNFIDFAQMKNSDNSANSGRAAATASESTIDDTATNEAITTMGTSSSTTQSTNSWNDDEQPSALKSIDTIEGFQKFADSLIATD